MCFPFRSCGVARTPEDQDTNARSSTTLPHTLGNGHLLQVADAQSSAPSL